LKLLTSYRQSFKKPKLTLIVLLIIIGSFMAGAVAESTAGILQNLAAALPQVQETVKDFIRDKVVFKLNAWTESRGGFPSSYLEVIQGEKRMIRGP